MVQVAQAGQLLQLVQVVEVVQVVQQGVRVTAEMSLVQERKEEEKPHCCNWLFILFYFFFCVSRGLTLMSSLFVRVEKSGRDEKKS